MYESPINFVFSDVQTQIVKQRENEMYMAIQKCGVDVDKEELIRALKYDREQYEKGYEDAVRQVKEDIIKKLMTQREWYRNLYAEFMDGEYYRSSLLLDKVMDIVKEA